MTLSNSTNLLPAMYTQIRSHAMHLLQEAKALGRFPTPIEDIVNAAHMIVDYSASLDERYLEQIHDLNNNETLKRALGKVLGVCDVTERYIVLDRSVLPVQRRFVTLHEVGHGVLSWQRDLYKIIEESKQTLAPDVNDLFDREANAFAAELLFQLDHFTNDCNARGPSLKVPLELSKKYGASIYASIRRYVDTVSHCCTVLVFEPVISHLDMPRVATLRRMFGSPSFMEQIGLLAIPTHITRHDSFVQMLPKPYQKMSGPRKLEIKDSHGNKYEAIAEAFTQGYQIFVLMHTFCRQVPSLYFASDWSF